jgi:hypothetical protein
MSHRSISEPANIYLRMPVGFNRDCLAVGIMIALGCHMIFRLLHKSGIFSKVLGLRHAEPGFAPNRFLAPHNLHPTHRGVLIVVYVFLISLLVSLLLVLVFPRSLSDSNFQTFGLLNATLVLPFRGMRSCWSPHLSAWEPDYNNYLGM